MLLAELIGEAVEFGLGLRERDAWLESRGPAEPAPSPVIERQPSGPNLILHHHRRPEIGREVLICPLETFRHDAHDREWMAVDVKFTAHSVLVSPQSTLPKRLANHHQRMRAWRQIVFRQERAPQRRIDA